MISAGRLKHKVTIQRLPEKDNSFGEVAGDTFIDVIEAHMEILPLTSNETIRAQASQLNVTHRCRMRYSAEVTAGSRILWKQPNKNRFLNIVSMINVEEKNTELEMLCVEVQK